MKIGSSRIGVGDNIRNLWSIFEEEYRKSPPKHGLISIDCFYVKHKWQLHFIIFIIATTTFHYVQMVLAQPNDIFNAH